MQSARIDREIIAEASDIRFVTDHEKRNSDVIAARSPEGPQQSTSTRAHQAHHADTQYGPTHRRGTEAATLLRYCVPARQEPTVGMTH